MGCCLTPRLGLGILDGLGAVVLCPDHRVFGPVAGTERDRMAFNEPQERIKTGSLGGLRRQGAEKKSRRKCFTYNGLQSRGDWI